MATIESATYVKEAGLLAALSVFPTRSTAATTSLPGKSPSSSVPRAPPTGI